MFRILDLEFSGFISDFVLRISNFEKFNILLL